MRVRYIPQLIFSISLGCFLISLFLQYGLKLEPCPLCIMQRLCVLLITLTSGVSLIFPAIQLKKPYLFVHVLWVISGLYFVCRQLWLQSLPPDAVPACMPALNILVAYFPVSTLLQALFWGGGSCAVVKFHLLGLSLAAWSGVYFLIIAALLILLIKTNYES